jgi:hypothetical protein
MKTLFIGFLFLLPPCFYPLRGETNSLILGPASDQYFGRISSFFSPGQFQQVYRSNRFADTDAEIIELCAFAFRVDDYYTNSTTLNFGTEAEFFLGTHPSPGHIMYDNLPQPTPVFRAPRLTATIAAGRSPRDFDVNINFQFPFRYDRRAGDLILQVSYSGYVPLDAEMSFPDTDGYSLWYGSGPPCCENRFHGSLLTTKVYYTVPTVFLGAAVLPDTVELLLQSEDEVQNIQIEQADIVTGTFTPLGGAALERLSAKRLRIRVARPSGASFWRIAQMLTKTK